MIKRDRNLYFKEYNNKPNRKKYLQDLRNSQKFKEYHIQYKISNKLKIQKYKKEYDIKNKEKNKLYKKQYNLKNSIILKNIAKKYQLKKYNLTLDEYNVLLKKQKYCCKICKRHNSLFKRALAVDHCHKTNKIRGLLCNTCNQGIGHLQDSIILLSNTIKYLKQFTI